MPAFEGSISKGRISRTTWPGRDNGIVSLGVAQCSRRIGMAGRVKGDTYRTLHRIASRPRRGRVSRQISNLESLCDASTIHTRLRATILSL